MISVQVLQEILEQYPMRTVEFDARNIAQYIVQRLALVPQEKTTPVQLLNSLAVLENALEESTAAELAIWGAEQSFHADLFDLNTKSLKQAVSLSRITPLADALINLAAKVLAAE